jgi:hypothetical protein
MEILVILSVLFGLAAIAMTIIKPSPNAQAIRALGVVSIFASTFWVSLAAVAWAVIEFAMSAAPAKKGKK